MTSSGTRPLRVITSVTRSVVPSRMSARWLASTWTAPRIALTATRSSSALIFRDVIALPGYRRREGNVVPKSCSWATARRPAPRSQADCRVQLPDFGGGERPRGSRPQVAEGDRAHLGAHQPGHRIARGGQEPAHDVLAPLVQGDLDQGTGAGPLHHPELVGAGHAVVQLDPGEQPPPQVTLDRAGHVRQVGLGHAVPGMRQPVREIAVVGEQHQAFGLIVQPAHVVQPFLPVAEEVADRPPAPVVRHRGEHPGGLVERQVHQVLAGWDAQAIHPDDLVVRIDPGAVAADGLAVDLDPPFGDQLLAVPAAAQARGGHHLLQPDPARDIDERVPLALVEHVVRGAARWVTAASPRTAATRCALRPAAGAVTTLAHRGAPRPPRSSPGPPQPGPQAPRSFPGPPQPRPQAPRSAPGPPRPGRRPLRSVPGPPPPGPPPPRSDREGTGRVLAVRQGWPGPAAPGSSRWCGRGWPRSRVRFRPPRPARAASACASPRRS